MIRTARWLLPPAIVLWGIAGTDDYGQRVLTVAGIYAIATIGYQFSFGRAGALSLAQGTFFGIGAYAAALVALGTGLPFLVGAVAGIAAASAVALVIAVPVLRLESHYLALATLAVAQLATLLAVNWVDVTGGANGLYGITGATLLGLPLSGIWLLVQVWTLVTAAWAGFEALMAGPLGPRLATMTATPLAAGAAGIDVGLLRAAMLVASAALAGLAGAVMVHTQSVVSPEVLSFEVMVAILTMAVVGGRGDAFGAILGALLLVHLPEWFRVLEGDYLLAYGAMLLAVIVAAPEGIVGLVPALRRMSKAPDLVAPPSTRAPDRGRLEARDLTRRFGGLAALDGVSLTVAPGEIVGLIGPNGSGKTTLVNVLTGTDSDGRGSVAIGGNDLSLLPAHRRAAAGLGRGFQHPQVAESLTPWESVRVAARTDSDAAAALARVAGTIPLDTPAQALPPAGRRRLEIARALALRPSFLLLDEPAAGLDADERADLATLLRDLAADGLGLLVVEHTMDFLLPLADRVVCMEAGRVIAEGTPATILENDSARAAYFGSRPVPRAEPEGAP